MHVIAIVETIGLKIRMVLAKHGFFFWGDKTKVIIWIKDKSLSIVLGMKVSKKTCSKNEAEPLN